MKELFREQDITRVSFFRNILEEAGIPTLIRNETLTNSGLSEIPIPEFFPALCVMNDDDYVTAVQLIRSHPIADNASADLEVTCPGCGEINPGNFEVCWDCGAPIPRPL